MSDQPSTSKKLNIVMSEKDLAAITQMAADLGLTLSHFVRETLRVGIWYEREVKCKGQELFVGNMPDGPMRQVKFSD